VHLRIRAAAPNQGFDEFGVIDSIVFSKQGQRMLEKSTRKFIEANCLVWNRARADSVTRELAPDA